jgi:hypothetical protein
MRTIYFITFFFLGVTITMIGQNSTQLVSQSVPVSWLYLDTTSVNTSNTALRTSLSSFNVPYHDNAILQSKADSISKNCKACTYFHYYGYGNVSTTNLKTSAQYYNPHIAGGKLWIMRITSQTALGLQFYFSKCMIPKKSFLYIYTADRGSLLGGYNSGKTPDDSTLAIHFGTTPIFGNEVYMEYYESDSADYTGSIVIDNIVHLFSPILSSRNSSSNSTTSGGSAPCQNDVDCIQMWDSEINSVAIIVAYNNNNNFTGTCSGSLINNTNADGTPYFLTAAHCAGLTSIAGGPYPIGTWQFIFDYQNIGCNTGTSSPYSKTVYGAYLLKHDTYCPTGQTEYAANSDYMLLRLNTNLGWTTSNNICYAGWEYQDPIDIDCANDSVLRQFTGTIIHHPKSDVKKITTSTTFMKAINLRDLDTINVPPCSNTWSCEDFYTYSSTVGGGGTEPGSSGAPVFDDNHRIIGTVTGAWQDPVSYNPCYDNTYVPYFGRFSRHWTSSGGIFKQYLDPYGKTDSTNSHFDPNFDGVDTYCPYTFGGGTVNPPGGTQNSVSDGILCGIPGQPIQAGIPVLCLSANSDLYIYPKTGQYFNLPSQNFQVDCADCSSNNAPGGYSCTKYGPPWNRSCYADGYPYTLFITKVDANFQDLSPVYSFCYHNIGSSPGGGPSHIDICPGCLVNSSGNHFPGLVAGNFYAIGMMANGGQFANAYFYVLPNNLDLNNSNSFGDTVSLNLFSKGEITLQNTTVKYGVDVVAATYIDVQKDSRLMQGHYFIEPVTCGSFRMANPNNTPKKSNVPPVKNNLAPTSHLNNNTTYISSVKKNASSISLYPNPVNSNTIIELKGNETGKSAWVRVFSSTGQLVVEDNVILNQPILNLNLSYLNSGMYNVLIVTEKKRWQTKFIKE